MFTFLMGILFLYIQSEYNMFQLLSTATYLCSSAVSLTPSSLHLPIKWLHTVLRSQLSFLSLQMNKPTFPSLWVIRWTCSTLSESFLHLEAQKLACYSPRALKIVKITSFSLLQMNMCLHYCKDTLWKLISLLNSGLFWVAFPWLDRKMPVPTAWGYSIPATTFCTYHCWTPWQFWHQNTFVSQRAALPSTYQPPPVWCCHNCSSLLKMQTAQIL